MINGRVKEAEQTEASINETREKYRPAAIRGSILYFVVADLALIGPMYQYSLNFFMQLFSQCIDNSEPSDELRKRLKNIMSYTTYFVYVSVCRGLFEEHKLLFSLLVCTSIMRVMTVQEKLDEARRRRRRGVRRRGRGGGGADAGWRRRASRRIPRRHRGARVERFPPRYPPQLRGAGQDDGVGGGFSLEKRVLPGN